MQGHQEGNKHSGSLPKYQSHQSITHEKKNRSLSRNLGANIASGEFLAFVDSDVQLDAYWFANSIHAFQNKLVAASQGSFLMDRQCSFYDKTYGFIPRIPQCISSSFGPVIVTGACIYRKRIFFSLGMFDENVLWNEDLNLSVTAFYKGFALSYEATSQAILLPKKSIPFDRIKRSFTAGFYLCGLQRYKFSKTNAKKTAFWMMSRAYHTFMLGLKSRNNKLDHLFAAANEMVKLTGFVWALVMQRQKQTFSFPQSFTPYLGFNDSFRKSNNHFGLIYVNKERHLFAVNNAKMICLK